MFNIVRWAKSWKIASNLLHVGANGLSYIAILTPCVYEKSVYMIYPSIWICSIAAAVYFFDFLPTGRTNITHIRPNDWQIVLLPIRCAFDLISHGFTFCVQGENISVFFFVIRIGSKYSSISDCGLSSLSSVYVCLCDFNLRSKFLSSHT